MKKIEILTVFTAIIALIFSSLSCSINYKDEDEIINVAAPDLTFTNASFKKYENHTLTAELKAQTLEQYSRDSTSYARQAEFFTWDKNSQLVTQGKCMLLGIQSKEAIYTLFTNIVIDSFQEDARIMAQNLKWNGETEQLVSGLEDRVYIKKGDMELEGKGFSASGVSKSFRFDSEISGTMIPEEQPETENQLENTEMGEQAE